MGIVALLSAFAMVILDQVGPVIYSMASQVRRSNGEPMEPFLDKNSHAARAEDEALRLDPRWALVERVAASAAFQKAPKLREFLLYVCETTLRNHAEDVREQQIGVCVFNRRPDYNMSEDSIVRVQARELRKRLAVYFETDGRDEPLVFSIPKGRYIPVFAPRGAAIHEPFAVETCATAEAEEHPAAAPLQVPSRRSGLALQIVGGLLLAVLGWFCGMLFTVLQRIVPLGAAFGSDNALYDSILGTMGRDGKDTLIVLSNPRLILYSGRSEVPKDLVDSGTLLPVPPALDRLLASARNLGETPDAKRYIQILVDTYTGIGEAACAYNLGRLMQSMNRSVRLTEGRFLNWDAAKQQHLIVLGSPAINNWTHENVSTPNFVFVERGIRNVAPRAEEQREYLTKEDPAIRVSVDYGVISMSTSASGARILTLAGRAVSGTHGAGDFFVNPEKMKPVYKRLKAANPKGAFPSNWEVLIRVDVRENIPVETSFVTLRANPSVR
jgi:hypothetical protein